MADQSVIEIIQKYGLVAIFLAVFLEYACFPVPSEIVLPLSGAVAAQGGFTFLSVYLICIAAGLGGSLLDYSLARWGGVRMMEKLERRFPKLAGGLEVTRQKFEKYAAFSVGICRVIPLCRTYISFIAGLAKQDLGTFLGASTIGIAIWNALLVWAGYLLSENWQVVGEYYGKYKYAMLAIIVLGIFTYILLKRMMGKKEEEAIAQARERRRK